MTAMAPPTMPARAALAATLMRLAQIRASYPASYPGFHGLAASTTAVAHGWNLVPGTERLVAAPALGLGQAIAKNTRLLKSGHVLFSLVVDVDADVDVDIAADVAIASARVSRSTRPS